MSLLLLLRPTSGSSGELGLPGIGGVEPPGPTLIAPVELAVELPSIDSTVDPPGPMFLDVTFLPNRLRP